MSVVDWPGFLRSRIMTVKVFKRVREWPNVGSARDFTPPVGPGGTSSKTSSKPAMRRVHGVGWTVQNATGGCGQLSRK